MRHEALIHTLDDGPYDPSLFYSACSCGVCGLVRLAYATARVDLDAHLRAVAKQAAK